MILIEVRRSADGYNWIAEEKGQSVLCDPFGKDRTILGAIEDFLRCFKIMNGFSPEYKWIGEIKKTNQ